MWKCSNAILAPLRTHDFVAQRDAQAQQVAGVGRGRDKRVDVTSAGMRTSNSTIRSLPGVPNRGDLNIKMVKAQVCLERAFFTSTAIPMAQLMMAAEGTKIATDRGGVSGSQALRRHAP